MLSSIDIINSLNTIEKYFKKIGVDTRTQYNVELCQQNNTLAIRNEWDDTISTQSIIYSIQYSARSQETADNLIEWVQKGVFFTKHHCYSGDDGMDITFHSQPIVVKENLGRFGTRQITYYIKLVASITVYV